MRGSAVELVIQGLKEAGISLVCALPESRLRELYVRLSREPGFTYIPVTNEAEGVSIVAGAWLTGMKGVMIMENSGLRVACEPLARLGLTHGIPVLLMMSYRGEFGEPMWYGIPHGITMEPILTALRIPYLIVDKEGDIKEAVLRARSHISSSLYHVAIIFSGELLQ